MKFAINILLIIVMVFMCGCLGSKEVILDEELIKNMEFSDIRIIESNLTYKSKIMKNNIDYFSNINSICIIYFTIDEHKSCFFTYDDNNKNISYAIVDSSYSMIFQEFGILVSIEGVQPRVLKYYVIVRSLKDGSEIFKVENSYKRNVTQDEVQELYYLEPVLIKKSSDGEGIEIFWEQAHYPMSTAYYWVPGKRLLSSSNDDGYSINELSANSFSISDNIISLGPNSFDLKVAEEISEKKIKACAFNKNNNSWAFVITNTDSNEYSDYSILIFSVDKEAFVHTINLSDTFAYQDPLVSVVGADSQDNYLGFIIETKEFTYDYYIYLDSFEIDVFLRPSSFVTRYPK